MPVVFGVLNDRFELRGKVFVYVFLNPFPLACSGDRIYNETNIFIHTAGVVSKEFFDRSERPMYKIIIRGTEE